MRIDHPDVGRKACFFKNRWPGPPDQPLSISATSGAKYVGGILYSAFQKYAEPPTEAGIMGAADAIRRAAEKAAASGITLGMLLAFTRARPQGKIGDYLTRRGR